MVYSTCGTHTDTHAHTRTQLWLQFVTVARIYKCGTWEGAPLLALSWFLFPFFMLPMFTRSTTFCWSSTNHQAFCSSPFLPLCFSSPLCPYSCSSSYQPRLRPAVPFRYAYTAVFDLCVCVEENVLTCVSLEFSSLFFCSSYSFFFLLLLLFSCCLVACVALLLFQSIDAF